MTMIDDVELRHKLGNTARALVENGKGIFAADESESSIEKRFAKVQVENTEENRRKFRQIFITTNDVHDKLSGIILHEETFKQCADNGKLFVDILNERGIAPGIKLDKGLIDFKENEKVSVGLEDLDKRLKNDIYRKAKFAKWRSVFSITDKTPTEACLHENCSVLARYAEICQKYGIVPIVEPEVLWEGKHTIEETKQVTKTVLSCLMYHLNLNDIYMPGILVKPAFVTQGKDAEKCPVPKQVAAETFACLIDTIPVGVPGIVFLSGGHPANEATLFLDSINKEKGKRTWNLSFSYGRALSEPVLNFWKGEDKNMEAAKEIFRKRLEDTSKAAQGNYLEE